MYDVKHVGRHKARLVAGGHLIDTPLESVYSGAVSLRSVCIVAFIAELNDLDLWATDIGNAYLEAYTSELVCIIAGPEFGDLGGCLLIIIKALYGLKSSGFRWYERFAIVVREIGFFQCKADPEVWMRDKGDHYEYVSVFVDDLEVASKGPESIMKMLTDDYKFKLKGTGPLEFYLGCGFHHDLHGTLCQNPKKYIKKMLTNFEKTFGYNS